MDTVYKQFIVDVVKSGEAEGIFEIVISTETPDREGDIIEVDGWQTDDYMKNPVVLWSHSYGSVPIAKTLGLRKEEARLVAVFQWREPSGPSDPVLPIRAAWDQGILRAASVGFRPLEWEAILDEEDADDPWAAFFAPRRYRQQELLEWSIVPIPANQEALRLSAKALSQLHKVNPYLPAEYREALNQLSPAAREGEQVAPNPTDDAELDAGVLGALSALVATIKTYYQRSINS